MAMAMAMAMAVVELCEEQEKAVGWGVGGFLVVAVRREKDEGLTGWSDTTRGGIWYTWR